MASRFSSGGSSRFAAPVSSASPETDYAHQSLIGIQKVMAVNPMLGNAMFNAYEAKTQPATGILSGLWNAVSSPARGLIGALGNITSTFAEPFRDEEKGDEDSFIKDMWQGLSGQENTYWRDVLISHGAPDSFGTTVAGFVGDVMFDPTTYLGAGMLGKTSKIVATTGQDLVEHGAKNVLMKEIAQRGGLEFGGRFISKTDDFVSVTKDLSEESLKKLGVSDEVVAGVAGIVASQAERSVIGSLEALAQKSYESIGRKVGDVIIQRKSIMAIPEAGYVDDIGRKWSKSELVKIFKDTRKLGVDDLVKLGNSMYDTSLKGAQGAIRYQQLGRTAAAAEGGLRFKFGVPFGEKLAKWSDTPWLAYRWQTGALPYANRFKFGKGLKVNGKLIEEGFSFTKAGDFFRGVSGINRLDNAIQNSLQYGGPWNRKHWDIMMAEGFGGELGLRAQMMQGTLAERKAFQELFGNKSVSSFITASQRMGAFTSGITAGSQMWRRGGVVGLRASDALRTAKAQKRVFRAFAATDEESWTKTALQYDEDANKGLIDAKETNEKIISYLEGLTDDLDIPEYLSEPIKQMRNKYPSLLEQARKMGADVGDITEVYAYNAAERVIKEGEKRLEQLEAEKLKYIDPENAGKTMAFADKITSITKDIMRVKKDIAEAQVTVGKMDTYEAMVASIRGERVAEKLGPRNYFHRRLTKEARAALMGSPRAGTRTFNKRKIVAAATERKLAKFTFEEAKKVIASEYPELAKVKKIFEDNPFRVYAHYVEDIAEEVYKAGFGRQAKYVMNHLGGVDNGTFVDLIPKMRANMERTVRKMEAQAAGKTNEGRKIVGQWEKSMITALGGDLGDIKTVPQTILDDLGLTVDDVPTGKLPILPEAQMQKLEGVMNELNKLKAGINDFKAEPETALKAFSPELDMSYWGRVDVPGMENIVMHPFIAAEFNKAWAGTAATVGGEVGKVQQAWRQYLLGPWKKWATIYFPGFHARNYMGAWFNNWLGGVNDSHYAGAQKIMDVLEKGKESKFFGTKMDELPELSLRNLGIDGHTGAATYGDVAKAMRDSGVYATNSLALADLRLLGTGEEGLTYSNKTHRVSGKLGKKRASRYGPVTSAERFMRGWEGIGVNVTGFVENKFRTAAFLKGLEDTAGDVAGARAFTMMRHGDYEELTDAEMFIKDVLPFYKWIRTNFPFQLRTMMENPGKQLATVDAMNVVADPEQRKHLPDWMKEAVSIKLPKPISDAFTGQDAAAFLTLQLPLNDMFLSSNEFASSFLPVVRQVLIENQVFKKNLFTGAPIEGTTFKKAHDWVEFTGMGVVMDALGVAQRDVNGDLLINDKWMNTLQAFPIFARTKNWLFSDPDRTKFKVNAFVAGLLDVSASVTGVGVRAVGAEELNDAEADYYFNFIKPQLDILREKGYPLPTATDLGMAATEATEDGGRF